MVLVDEVSAGLELISVELAAESKMYHRTRPSLVEDLGVVNHTIQDLPGAESSAVWTADEEQWSLLLNKPSGFVTLGLHVKIPRHTIVRIACR